MVALIKMIKSISRSFYYNERKLSLGDASCLMVENYPLQLAELNQSDRLQMLQKMAALNPRTKVNGLHIFLNFDPSNQLSSGVLREIAKFYMQGIGFGNQPYLMYQHFDAAHPHLHILTTNIRADGSRINLFMKTSSFQSLAKQIRIRYGLLTGGEGNEVAPASGSKPAYGESQTFRGMAKVLKAVLGEYHFTSFAEVNAILGLYNVQAERGKEGSQMFKNRGLIYRLLDGAGDGVGVPIKASALPCNPGLNMLEERFKMNIPLKLGLKDRVISEITLALNRKEIYNSASFCALLKNKGIDVILRRDAEGRLQEITYVDHHSKCVFPGADLGQPYSANGVLRGFDANQKNIGADRVNDVLEFEDRRDLLALSHLPAVAETKSKERRRKQRIQH
ncbi:relaxase/mobilization nuclease domain-containing protein [Pedobacter foliorum]|uniref:relaxase/mobilization nuclease domain-containing protein n=1 Tax=Pedobacter foliorum TaxID=2739058 RepID=UPI00156783A5|nr:relaxase/mobilization nuclease domain-containing protein [Pedobacter foliorum]NRF41132.1 relaxase/mobilization nuclease domain-containing protein [Pedobacter foliorum]